MFTELFRETEFYDNLIFLSNTEIWVNNRNLGQLFFKNRNVCKKSKFWPKPLILVKNKKSKKFQMFHRKSEFQTFCTKN